MVTTERNDQLIEHATMDEALAALREDVARGRGLPTAIVDGEKRYEGRELGGLAVRVLRQPPKR